MFVQTRMQAHAATPTAHYAISHTARTNDVATLFGARGEESQRPPLTKHTNFILYWISFY